MHQNVVSRAVASTTLLHVAGDPNDPPIPVLLSLAVAPSDQNEDAEVVDSNMPMKTARTCIISMAKFDWESATQEPAILYTPVSNVSTTQLTVVPGTIFCIRAATALPADLDADCPFVEDAGDESSAHSDSLHRDTDVNDVADPILTDQANGADGNAMVITQDPAATISPNADTSDQPLVGPCRLAIMACSDSQVQLGDMSLVLQTNLALHLQSLEGNIDQVRSSELHDTIVWQTLCDITR